MFRYLAHRYDRKHVLRSLERQRRIHDKAIPFSRYGSDALVFNEISKGEMFFAPIFPAVPLREEADSVIFQSDISTEDQANNTFECVVTDSGFKQHALVVFHHWYARSRYPGFSKYFARKGITVIEATLPYHFGRASNDYSEENFSTRI
ncbi:hypothetical protein [Mesorhizobium sp. M0977]|uniref:hypothetical protein n=1 Tax=Mesorhizobium sp. M0977 TaxID=2957039 RepID=UPI003334E814